MVIAVFVSAASGVLAGFAYGSLYGAGIAVASAAALTLIAASTGLDPADATRPLATLINDRNFAIIMAIDVAAYAFLYYVTIYGLATVFVLAGMCVLAIICASSYVRYLVAVYYGVMHYRPPFRFANFLNWCHSTGILRISGIGYQFRHEELLHYFTTGAPDPRSILVESGQVVSDSRQVTGGGGDPST
jgi:hypothetical protein